MLDLSTGLCAWFMVCFEICLLDCYDHVGYFWYQPPPNWPCCFWDSAQTATSCVMSGILGSIGLNWFGTDTVLIRLCWGCSLLPFFLLVLYLIWYLCCLLWFLVPPLLLVPSWCWYFIDLGDIDWDVAAMSMPCLGWPVMPDMYWYFLLGWFCVTLCTYTYLNFLYCDGSYGCTNTGTTLCLYCSFDDLVCCLLLPVDSLLWPKLVSLFFSWAVLVVA
jgi:phage shock protein PspC (stress-responsive transcriptional regulator)